MSRSVAAVVLIAVIAGGAWWYLRLRHPAETRAESVVPSGQVSTFSKSGQPRAKDAGASTSRGAASGQGRRANVPSNLPLAGEAIAVPNPPSSPVRAGDGNSDSGSTGTIERVVVPPTYDATNTDVVPPVLVSSRVPQGNKPRQDAPAGAIRIVIKPDGSIESAKATINPQTIGETVFVVNALSIVKTWHFQPAMRNGQPVRYAVLVPLNRF